MFFNAFFQIKTFSEFVFFFVVIFMNYSLCIHSIFDHIFYVCMYICFLFILKIYFHFFLFWFFLVTRLGSAWHVAHTTIIAPYKAFSREKLPARIGTHIGLMHVNVTLTGKFVCLFVSFFLYIKLFFINKHFLP